MIVMIQQCIYMYVYINMTRMALVVQL